MKPLITVFTPTYNRAYTINKCYESLKRQTCKDFEWLIIDDGSTDNTRDIVYKWINENNDFNIRYIYQENKGMHGAHNTAYENIYTELNVCIDSDDYMTDDAIEKIKIAWKKVRGNKKISGLAGLDANKYNQIIGDKFPNYLNQDTLFNFFYNRKITGDKKLVYRTELTKKYPYPLFEGEKYVGLAYKYYKLDEEYELYLINEILCIVEYMEDGSTKNMLRQYKKNPKGWLFYRIENLKLNNTSLKYKFIQCIHYISSSFMCKEKNFIMKSPNKVLTILALPFGIALYIYIMLKTNDIKLY
ncbi:glycosyltransferase family 2 protein [Clostridium perfringens]|uniref:glycosyltransferase family 2 protein n=1 Tax=Clostridium perfringens TaxID=1502 RepID=UPI003D342C73